MTDARLARRFAGALAAVLANAALVVVICVQAGAGPAVPEAPTVRELAATAAPGNWSPLGSSPGGTRGPALASPIATTAPPPPPAPAPAVSAAVSLSSGAAPVVAAAPVPADTLPAYGRATAWGCAAALAYLRAYAAPEYGLVCPGYAEGAQALTCFGESPCAPEQRLIVIADPCPAAYMNEAHNSWVLNATASGGELPGMGLAPPDGSLAIDPWGYCH